MASIEPYRWRSLCQSCQAAGRTTPKRDKACTCRITAWRVRWRTPDCKDRSKVFDRHPDAKAYAANVETAKSHGTYVDPVLSRQRLRDFVLNDWLPAQDWKATTVETWPGVWARIDPLLGGYPLGAIDQLVIKKARAQLVAQGYAHGTVKQTMAYIGMILRAAHAAGRIGRNPAAGLKPPKARADDSDGKVRPEDVPTRAEALALYHGTPEPFRAGTALGMAGLRVGEVLGVAEDRIDLDAGRVTVDRQLQRIDGRMQFTTPKAEKVRTITVPDLTREALQHHLEVHGVDHEGRLFQGLRGAVIRRDQFYASAWKPARVAAGMCDRCRSAELAKPRRDATCTCRPLPYKFHALRHFCASVLLAEGAALTAVAGHLGDTVETVAKVYVHWLRDDRDVPAAVLNRVLTVS